MTKLSDIDVHHRWTSDDARKLYELYASELREMTRKRAVDLGISMDDGDEHSAFELLKQNRRLRMSEEHRAKVWESWQSVIDPLVKRMTEHHMMHTVPVITINPPYLPERPSPSD